LRVVALACRTSPDRAENTGRKEPRDCQRYEQESKHGDEKNPDHTTHTLNVRQSAEQSNTLKPRTLAAALGS
jgi:hypothetical protein